MTYPLSSIMESIRVRLGAILPAEATMAEKDMANLQPVWYRGRRFLYVDTAPPRYVWFPENITPVGAYKGDNDGGKHEAVAGGHEVVVVHSWGVDEEQAWMLRHNLIAVAKNRLDADADYRGCEWDEGGDLEYGFAFATRFGFSVPIIGTTLAIVNPATIGTQGFMVINGSDNQGCGG